ncbi:MAG TPA: hypothetical protein VFW21_13085 [Mycobacterium sp.]|nr:hypothetical protein [Mycobacterium sp.]
MASISSGDGSGASFADAAFGAEPGCWPLPHPASPQQRWLRAVAAGGQGRYGDAAADLAVLRRTASGPLLSLTYSTQGSLIRQLGGHGLARGWEGRALALAGSDVQARVDALVGLAADALGTGRFALSSALLVRAGQVLDAAEDAPPRLAVRMAWVGAELAMATGDGANALKHARRGVELSGADTLGIRHVIKSNVVLAAALCCAGQVSDARTQADAMLEATQRHGLVPLQWALASLLDGIGSNTQPAARVQQIRDASAEVIRRRGGHWAVS